LELALPDQAQLTMSDGQVYGGDVRFGGMAPSYVFAKPGAASSQYVYVGHPWPFFLPPSFTLCGIYGTGGIQFSGGPDSLAAQFSVPLASTPSMLSLQGFEPLMLAAKPSKCSQAGDISATSLPTKIEMSFPGLPATLSCDQLTVQSGGSVDVAASLLNGSSSGPLQFVNIFVWAITDSGDAIPDANSLPSASVSADTSLTDMLDDGAVGPAESRAVSLRFVPSTGESIKYLLVVAPMASVTELISTH